jgi:hypothetical protein
MLPEFVLHDTNARELQASAELPLRVRGATGRSIRHRARHQATVAVDAQELFLSVNGDNLTSGPKTHSEPANWRLGVVTDRTGHVHLGALIAANGPEPSVYIDLLAAVGAATAAELDLDRLVVLVVLVRGEHVAHLRRLVEQCIDGVRLRNRLVELTEISTSVVSRTKWTE